MPNNYDDTLDYCERLLKTIFEEALTLEESTEYKLKEVQVIVAHLSNIEKNEVHEAHMDALMITDHFHNCHTTPSQRWFFIV